MQGHPSQEPYSVKQEVYIDEQFTMHAKLVISLSPECHHLDTRYQWFSLDVDSLLKLPNRYLCRIKVMIIFIPKIAEIN